MKNSRQRIPLSAPHLSGGELSAFAAALETNWLAAVGPDVDAFEEEFAVSQGAAAALATASGTSALHLALRVLGVGPGDEVLVSTLTFCASVNPIIYLGATPVFVDSDTMSWNMNAGLLVEELERRGTSGRLPAAVIVVHLYGQLTNMTPIMAACERWGVPIVEDAAEALGATTRGTGEPRCAGTLGTLGIFSFDGSKVITTSTGGMLVSQRPELIDHARKLARQAREPVVHYEHEEMGYNYRLSNLLAAVGRAQLRVLPDRVAARQAVFGWYERALAGIPGLCLQEEADWGIHARWLSCVTFDAEVTGVLPEDVRLALSKQGIESRPVWKPMHQQPVYQRAGYRAIGGQVADELFRTGLCLPSSSSLTATEVAAVAAAITEIVHDAR
jgi:dTDP-4-amino-4,6-dideoxygalactose transaminase